MSNQQKYEEVLSSPNKAIAVIAGPGSGKTKGILIPKIKKLIAEDSIDTSKILLLTFSRASAQDLAIRFSEENKMPRISTLHSLCLSFLLSENNHDIRKRVDSIILDFEYEALISDIKNMLPKLNKRDIKKMLKEFSAGWARLPHDEVFSENEGKKQFKSLIINWLDEYEAAMMEEIVYHAVNLAKQIQSSFIEEPEYILVDEFQDLNKLEQEFVDLLALKSKLLLVVGDPDQSIYSFKYAHPEGITNFSKRATVNSHSLEFIGRSPKKIVALANEILKQANPTRVSLLKPLPENEEGEIKITRFSTQDEEFQFIVESIDKIIESGETPEEVLVLTPKKKLGVEFVKYAVRHLDNKPYSYHVTSKVEFTAVEKEKILLLGLLANPKSVLHIRSYLGLGDDNHYTKEIDVIKNEYGNLKNALNQANPDDFNARERRIRTICNKLVNIRNFLASNTEIADITKVLDELFPKEVEETKEIRKVLTELQDDNDSVLSLYTKLIDYIRTIKSDKEQIKVMTLLSSKGLEANHVFILGCNGGNIPGNNHSVYLDDHEYKQEQRRLLYVGITRAKKSLTITWCQYIPYEQSMGHQTAGVGVRTINEKKYSRVSISEFLQDISMNE